MSALPSHPQLKGLQSPTLIETELLHNTIWALQWNALEQYNISIMYTVAQVTQAQVTWTREVEMVSRGSANLQLLYSLKRLLVSGGSGIIGSATIGISHQ